MESAVELKMPRFVTLKPFREHTHLPKDSDGLLRHSRTYERLTVQISASTNIINTGLTEDDERRLEIAMRLAVGTLSKYNREWWGNFKMEIPKNGIKLDTRLPMDEIKYKVALVHSEVAPSEAEKYFTPFANYVLTSEEQETQETLKSIEVEAEAYKEFSKLNINGMKDFLLVFGKNVKNDALDDFVKGAVGKTVKEEPAKFLEIIQDPNFKTKVFIKQCVIKNVLKESGTKYVMHGGDVLGYTMQATIDYLTNPENQEVYRSLKAQMEAIK